MARATDRVDALFEGGRRKIKHIVTPEGVTLDVQIADRAERLGAFLLDAMFWLGGTILIYILIFLGLASGMRSTIAFTAAMFCAFLLRNLYFIHFELVWQGSTPGKRIMGLKVIQRDGGELQPGAIVARNLTREVEFFLPLSVLLSTSATEQVWTSLSLLGWTAAVSALPLFNRENLRAGDLIGGTLVIAMPRRALAADVALPGGEIAARPAVIGPAYVFSRAQLQIYGTYEVQVLEELLRRPPGSETNRMHADIAGKIARKIGWSQPVGEREATGFLQAFYAAARAELERGQLFGQFRDDKASGVRKA